jgi:membrane associated rhomboid family serine protease
LFLPIGDTPNPERFTPFATWGLMAINIAVYFLICMPLSSKFPETSSPLLLEYIRMLAARGFSGNQIQTIISQTTLNDLLLFQYGYKPASPSIASLFSSLFLHGSFMHLAGNMLFLYIYGDNVEHQLGRLKFILMYFLTGVIATLSFAVLAGNSMAPLVGASGAISGVLGFYFYMFPRNKVKVFILLFPIYLGVVRIPARIVLGIFVLIDNLLPVILQAGGGVAYGAHLGGFFGGLGIAALGEFFEWQLPFQNSGKFPRRYTTAAKMSNRSSRQTRPTTTREALSSSDIDTLLEALKHVDEDEIRALSPQEILLSAGTLEKHGYLTPAAKMLKIALSVHKKSPLIPEVFYELGRVRLREGYPTAAYQHLLTALDLSTSAETETKIRRLLQEIKT